MLIGSIIEVIIIKVENYLQGCSSTSEQTGRGVDISARGNSVCRHRAMRKTKVLQGTAEGAVMAGRGQVAGKGAREREQTCTEGCPML